MDRAQTIQQWCLNLNSVTNNGHDLIAYKLVSEYTLQYLVSRSMVYPTTVIDITKTCT